MSAEEIDAYLASLEAPKRSTLTEMRVRILAVVPAAEQSMSYSLPAFTLGAKKIAGLGAFSKHLSYLPHSGSVLPRLSHSLGGYTFTKGALHFPVDEPLPQDLIELLLMARIQAGASGSR